MLEVVSPCALGIHGSHQRCQQSQQRQDCLSAMQTEVPLGCFRADWSLDIVEDFMLEEKFRLVVYSATSPCSEHTYLQG